MDSMLTKEKQNIFQDFPKENLKVEMITAHGKFGFWNFCHSSMYRRQTLLHLQTLNKIREIYFNISIFSQESSKDSLQLFRETPTYLKGMII